MKFKANPIYKPSNFQMDVWQVEKLVELPALEFDALVTTPLADHPVIAENKKYMFSNGGTLHGLLVLGEGRRDGVLVMSEKGYDFVRYGAYATGARISSTLKWSGRRISLFGAVLRTRVAEAGKPVSMAIPDMEAAALASRN